MIRAFRFEHALVRQAARRHTRILEPDGLPLMPVGWRAEDFGGPSDGFVPISLAANTMGLVESELLDVVRRGLLEVRPAIVSVLAVRPRSGSQAESDHNR